VDRKGEDRIPRKREVSRRGSIQSTISTRYGVQRVGLEGGGLRTNQPWLRSEILIGALAGIGWVNDAQPLSARFTAARISSTVIWPSFRVSPAGQRDTDALPRAMLTMTRISSTVTVPSPLQSPEHSGVGLGVTLGSGRVADRVAVGVFVSAALCVYVWVAVAVRVRGTVAEMVARGGVWVGMRVDGTVGAGVPIGVVAARDGVGVGVFVDTGAGVAKAMAPLNSTKPGCCCVGSPPATRSLPCPPRQAVPVSGGGTVLLLA
jgi:hypothetical protein